MFSKANTRKIFIAKNVRSFYQTPVRIKAVVLLSCIATGVLPPQSWADVDQQEGSKTNAPSATSTSITELLLHARDHSPILKEQNARIHRAQADKRLAWAAWMPLFQAQGQGRVNSVEADLDLGGAVASVVGTLGIADPNSFDLSQLPPPTEIQPRWVASGILSVRQLIFDPQAIFAPRVAASGLALQKAIQATAEQDLFYTIIRISLGIDSLKAVEGTAQRAIEVAEQRLRDARSRLDGGIATPLDVSRAESTKTEAESAYQSIRAQRQRLIADLRAVSGWDQNVQVGTLESVTDLLSTSSGLESRPELDVAKSAVKVAKRQALQASARWLPTVFAEGQLIYQSFGGLVGEEVQGTGFVGIQIPLFDASRYAQRSVAQAELTQRRAALERQRRALTAQETQAQASKQESESRLQLAVVQLKTSEATVSQVERLYQEGLATSLDLQTADAQRFTADRSVEERKLALVISELALARARGARVQVENNNNE